jgi:hypothetical protein
VKIIWHYRESGVLCGTYQRVMIADLKLEVDIDNLKYQVSELTPSWTKYNSNTSHQIEKATRSSVRSPFCVPKQYSSETVG